MSQPSDLNSVQQNLSFPTQLSKVSQASSKPMWIWPFAIICSIFAFEAEGGADTTFIDSSPATAAGAPAPDSKSSISRLACLPIASYVQSSSSSLSMLSWMLSFPSKSSLWLLSLSSSSSTIIDVLLTVDTVGYVRTYTYVRYVR